MARQAGKPDWQRMTIAVLKNRLLQLTDGQFSEREEGFETFRALLLNCHDIVKVDTSGPAATVELLEKANVVDTGEGAFVSHSPDPSRRIRQDLWSAVLDIRSDRQYVWDTTNGKAREKIQGDTFPVLPSLSPEELAQWRKEFLEEHHATLTPAAQKTLDRWYAEILPASYLPKKLQGHWIRKLAGRIDARLQDWFKRNSLEAPTISTIGQPSNVDDEVVSLRSIVIDCVQVMTKAELDELRLPPAVFLRAKHRRGT